MSNFWLKKLNYGEKAEFVTIWWLFLSTFKFELNGKVSLKFEPKAKTVFLNLFSYLSPPQAQPHDTKVCCGILVRNHWDMLLPNSKPTPGLGHDVQPQKSMSSNISNLSTQSRCFEILKSSTVS